MDSFVRTLGALQGGVSMSNRPCRFVHAGDFRLHLPLSGVAEVPEHLFDLFLDAPYRAAERVFDHTLAIDADWLLLSGDLIHPELAGPRGVQFLLDQFERLRASDVSIYWLPSELESLESWPASLRLPSNVHVLPPDRLDRRTVERRGSALAQIIGQSGPTSMLETGDGWRRHAALFTVAMRQGSISAADVERRDIDYWALGGAPSRRTVEFGRKLAHQPGSPQGRAPAEQGTFGCTQVEVLTDVAPRVTHVPLDAARWRTLRIAATDSGDIASLEQQCAAALDELIASQPGVTLLVHWEIDGAGPLAMELNRAEVAAKLLTRLRERFGHCVPAAWSCALRALPPPWEQPSADDDSFLGEFRRRIAAGATATPEDPLFAEALRFADDLPSETLRAKHLALDVALSAASSRRRVLGEAALLGAELLVGKESHR